MKENGIKIVLSMVWRNILRSNIWLYNLWFVFFVYFLLYAFAKYHFSRTWKDKINYLFSAIQNGCRTINVKKLRSFGSFRHNENCTYVTIDDKIPIKKQRKYLS